MSLSIALEKARVGERILASNFLVEPRQAYIHVMICYYISHHLFFAYYMSSGLNVKLVLQAMVERNASQREVEEVACSMVPKNN